MTSEIVNSLQKSILLLYRASQLPSNSAQVSVLPPQSRAFRQPLQPPGLPMPFIPNSPFRPQTSSTTGFR